MNGESNRKVIENYLLLLVSVYYNYLLLEDFDPLLLITGYYFENQSITYYFSITYYPMSAIPINEFEFEFCFSSHLCQLWLIRD